MKKRKTDIRIEDAELKLGSRSTLNHHLLGLILGGLLGGGIGALIGSRLEIGLGLLSGLVVGEIIAIGYDR